MSETKKAPVAGQGERYYPIDEAAARTAWEMFHLGGYEQGSVTAGYRRRVDEAYELAAEAAERDPGRASDARALADRYARETAAWIDRRSAIECQCPSPLVSGPANFPVQRKERQAAALAKHLEKGAEIESLLWWIEKIGEGPEVIRSSDPAAPEKLRARIKSMERVHETMKAVNAHYRRHGSLEGCEAACGAAVLAQAAERIKDCPRLSAPFPAFTLSNSLKRIKDAKARLEGIEAAKERGPQRRTVVVDGAAAELVENVELMRLQFLFPAAPSERARAVLKKHAFKWSPKNSAWQRQLTANARAAARRAVEEMAS